MPKTIISDTSVLILFYKIGELEILKNVYNIVYTTPEIVIEFGEPIPNWIVVEEVKDKKYQTILETQIDIGEASAIALAKEMVNSILLLDDLKARKLASKLSLKYTGTLGVISKAKQLGLISKVKPLLDKLLDTNFRISEKIIRELLIINNEYTEGK